MEKTMESMKKMAKEILSKKTGCSRLENFFSDFWDVWRLDVFGENRGQNLRAGSSSQRDLEMTLWNSA